MSVFKHVPVLVGEVVKFLNIKEGGVYVDATVGSGGHAAEILKRIGNNGLLIAIDCDEEAIERSKERLHEFADRVVFYHANFSQIEEVLQAEGVDSVDGILADLGLSSDQLEDPERGLSFSSEGPLDMRLDRSQGETAASLLGRISEVELAKILKEHGDERYAAKIARAIKQGWRSGKIRSTTDLANAIVDALPAQARRSSRIHPATRTFMALRKFINREDESLKEFLNAAVLALKYGGRLVVISFESGEDRIVKRSFKDFAQRGLGEILTKKPVVPSPFEVAKNLRARSAKLRAFERGSDAK